MKIVILLILQSAFALSPTESMFSIGENKITIYNYHEHRISMSEKCDDLSKTHFCKNIAFLKNLNKDIKKASLEKSTGGMNPGSIICTSVLKGIVVVAIDDKQNENSFCKLPSGLYIDSGTLTYYSKQ